MSTSGMFHRHRKSPLLAAVAMLTVCGVQAASGEGDRALMMERFDQIIIPAAEKAARRPVTDQGGQIAWGESYQLSALVEMLDATRDPKYAPLIVKLSDWIAKSRDDRQGLRDEVRGHVVTAWTSTNYSKGIRYAWAVHTGMIVAPMARFAAVVRSDKTLKARGPGATGANPPQARAARGRSHQRHRGRWGQFQQAPSRRVAVGTTGPPLSRGARPLVPIQPRAGLGPGIHSAAFGNRLSESAVHLAGRAKPELNCCLPYRFTIQPFAYSLRTR